MSWILAMIATEAIALTSLFVIYTLIVDEVWVVTRTCHCVDDVSATV